MVGLAGAAFVTGDPSSKTATSQTSALRSMSDYHGDNTFERDGLQPPRVGYGGRSMSVSNAASQPRSALFAVSGPRGSFSSDLRSTMVSRATATRGDLVNPQKADSNDKDGMSSSEKMVAELKEKLNKELKIKEGSENLLEALNMKKAKQTKEQRSRVESELSSTNRIIGELKFQIDELQQPKEAPGASRSRISNLFRGTLLRSTSEGASSTGGPDAPDQAETESPTFALSEILQSLETEGMQSDYYVERANNLVELFKRHPTLKYNLAWSDFGLRMQTLLLSDSREVVAAGYRVTRYAITDRKSLQTIRRLNTDYLVILSLVKEGKASVEREQALKFIRSFLDVKDGVAEVSQAVVRTIVAVAEHSEDRLRSICIETLAETLVRDPPLLVAAGGIGPLTDALADGTYEVPESLVAAFLYLLDMPRGRKYLRAGQGLEVVFSAFTDSLASHSHEQKLKANARVIAAMLRTWSGLMVLSMYNFRAIRSLVASLQFPQSQTRDIILELLFDILRIKPPSWSSSFLAGRRLTTYGRVTNLRSEPISLAAMDPADEGSKQQTLVDHFLSVILAAVFEAGLQKALLDLLNSDLDSGLRRKAILLLGEVQALTNRLLPSTQNLRFQILPELFSWAADFRTEGRTLATSTVYQIDSVTRTLQRSTAAPSKGQVKVGDAPEQSDKTRHNEQFRLKISAQIEEGPFRTYMADSQVLNTAHYWKWRWDIIQAIVEGPLLNPKRLDEATKAAKFMKRLVGFYRPFKYRFSDIKNTKPNQRYVRVGCSLIHSLLQTVEGVRYLLENKLLRQLAECLAQVDHMSGLTSQSPLFSPGRLAETLSCGYFAFIGTMSGDPNGLNMLERWRMINMCYHIVELNDRSDLIKCLLGNLDFSLDSHFRIMLSKALTASTMEIRIYATNLLRKYATTVPQQSISQGTVQEQKGYSEWAVRFLITQLYDPEVEVCETAVRILEEACNRTECLEFVVKCRPALDHLGEIGAPILLRFLSTSLGYRYLNGLDYITQEMDDWFLGRNDTYVTLVEASVARVLQGPQKARQASDDGLDRGPQGIAPPHFYRELTRTAEGCKLLREKGHFDEFVNTIREHGMEKDDAEIIVKVKGCLWAVGNVGSMELGGPFIEQSNVVEWIIQIAERSEVMTLRGTAFFVLGLISKSIHGLEILDGYGWDGVTTDMGESLGRCIPADLNRLLSIQPWSHDAAEAMSRVKTVKMEELSADEDGLNVRVLQLVVDLGNTVLTKKSVSELMHIKAKKPPGFQEARLFRKVMSILEAHHYRLPVRRFIIDLFDKSVLRQIVLEEEEEDDDDDDELGREDDDRPARN